ncbi:MAG TPA: hypothetical protein VF188_14465 [Longimicrobiales bacterium]
MPWSRSYLFCILLLAACDRPPTQPAGGADTVVLLGSEAGEILVVDPGPSLFDGPERRIPIPRFLDAFALSPDGATVYFTAFETLPERKLHAFDLRRLDMVRARAIADILGTDDTQDVVDSGGQAITVSPDGTTLFIAGWRSGEGALGIGVVDARSFELVGFVGPLRVRAYGLATLSPGAGRPEGAVLALGRRPGRTDPSDVYLFVIDPERQEVIDSMAGVVADTSAYQVVPAADGRHVYLSGSYSLTRYDLEARALREHVRLPTLGWLTLARDGHELYRSDKRVDPYIPGEGRVFVFGPDLDEREPVDLSGYPEAGSPPIVLSAASSRDGEFLYVVTGTASFERSPPYQPARLFVVRLADRAVERVIQLGSWNVGPPIVVP